MTKPRVRIPVSSLVAVLALVLGCAGAPPPPEEIQARLVVAQVPPDVACVRITAAGPGRTVVRELPVSPGGTITVAMSEPYTLALAVGEPYTLSVALSEPYTIDITLTEG